MPGGKIIAKRIVVLITNNFQQGGFRRPERLGEIKLKETKSLGNHHHDEP